MPTTQYHADALANDFALFCDDVRQIAIWRDLFAHGPPVSGLTITPSQGSLESIVEASRSVLLAGHHPRAGSHLWMFLADGPWQDDTRLANYWKIWRYLRREGIAWPESQKGPEIVSRSGSCVRYASTGLVDSTNFGPAMTIAFRRLCASFMLVSADDFLSEPGVLGLFNTAFSRLTDGSAETHVDWGRLIQFRAARGDVIIKRAGLFDEFAWSLDLFARPDVLEQFCKHGMEKGTSRERGQA